MTRAIVLIVIVQCLIFALFSCIRSILPLCICFRFHVFQWTDLAFAFPLPAAMDIFLGSVRAIVQYFYLAILHLVTKYHVRGGLIASSLLAQPVLFTKKRSGIEG
jgi:hypothetical protein